MTANTSNDLGKMLKQRRVMIPLTLGELAAKSSVSSSHLGRIEREERFPSAHILCRIAKPLGFEESELLTLARYLSPEAHTAESETAAQRLDPYVAMVLSQEPVEVQRTVISILNILKSITKRNGYNTSFAEYVHRRYPELDEDIITMIEDIIRREAAQSRKAGPCPKEGGEP